MLNQYESTPEFGNGNGGCGDDEMADDEDGGEDEEDEEDGDIVMYLDRVYIGLYSRSRKSPEKESLASFLLQLIPGDMSLGMSIPSDMSPRKAWKCRWG
ncbi:hypothetical protein Tco_1186201 [Tanacetum coccineum]